jgi:membrane protease YdiL (CAAX protease family)
MLLAAYPLVIGGLALLGGTQVQPALSSTVKGVLIVCAMELGVFGVVFTAAWLASRARARELYLSERMRWWIVPLSLAYSVGLRVAVGMIVAVIAGVLIAAQVVTMEQIRDFVTNNRPDVEALVDVEALRQNTAYLVLNATLVSFVVAGLREELWRAGVLAGLRALWPGRFSSLNGQLLGVTIAAVIFGLGHWAQGGLGVLLTGALGFFLGLIMVVHKSIWPAVLAHGAFNATTFIALPFLAEHFKDLL